MFFMNAFRLVQIAIAVSLFLIHSPALAQNSTSLIAQNPSAQYEIVKSISAEVFERIRRGYERSPEHSVERCVLGVVWSSQDEFTNGLSGIADEIIWISIVLSVAKYPSSVWQHLLENYERARLSDLIRNKRYLYGVATQEYERMKDRVSEYRRRSNPRLPEIRWEGGCGGDFMTRVVFRTDPAGAEVWVVPSFFHTLCARQRLNPDDPSQCNHGREHRDGSETEVSGTYRYVVRWPGGAVRTGSIDLDDRGLPSVRCSRRQDVFRGGFDDKCTLITINARQ